MEKNPLTDMSDDDLKKLRQLVIAEQELRADPLEGVPFVAIGAGERAPWADDPLTCPKCGEGPLPLQDSISSNPMSPVVLRFITHCGQSWLRGDVTL